MWNVKLRTINIKSIKQFDPHVKQYRYSKHSCGHPPAIQNLQNMAIRQIKVPPIFHLIHKSYRHVVRGTNIGLDKSYLIATASISSNPVKIIAQERHIL